MALLPFKASIEQIDNNKGWLIEDNLDGKHSFGHLTDAIAHLNACALDWRNNQLAHERRRERKK
jgi:hypothetical protein